MPRRRSTYDDDSDRLPEGMQRIAYDADSRVYTFQDCDGILYESKPGNRYGILSPVVDKVQLSRPQAFDCGNTHKRDDSAVTGSTLSSFHDFLPANCITLEKSAVDNNNYSRRRTATENQPSVRARWTKAIRKTALPKMQVLAHILLQSVLPRKSRTNTS